MSISTAIVEWYNASGSWRLCRDSFHGGVCSHYAFTMPYAALRGAQKSEIKII